MNEWASISLIALAPFTAAAIYFLGFRPIRSAPSGQTLQTLFWFYAISFMLTAISWGLIDMWIHGYGDADMF